MACLGRFFKTKRYDLPSVHTIGIISSDAPQVFHLTVLDPDQKVQTNGISKKRNESGFEDGISNLEFEDGPTKINTDKVKLDSKISDSYDKPIPKTPISNLHISPKQRDREGLISEEENHCKTLQPQQDLNKHSPTLHLPLTKTTVANHTNDPDIFVTTNKVSPTTLIANEIVKQNDEPTPEKIYDTQPKLYNDVIQEQYASSSKAVSEESVNLNPSPPISDELENDPESTKEINFSVKKIKEREAKREAPKPPKEIKTHNTDKVTEELKVLNNVRATPLSPGRHDDNSATDAGEVLNPPNQNYDRTRKDGIIAERVKEKPGKEIVIRKIEKDNSSKDLIRKAIEANDFLNNMMDETRLDTIIMAMTSQTYEANSYIITEGDTGAEFFVSAEGTFEVVKDNVVIKSFGAGVVFGELAILYKAKRFASIKVISTAKVWILERKVFQRIMLLTGRLEREENKRFLQSVYYGKEKVFNNLPETTLNQIADLLKREFHSTGSTIIQQGDPGDKFYIIRGGSVTVTKRDGAGIARIVGTMKRGQYFGEQALLSQEKRLASIIADAPGTECLTLDRIAFNEHIGPLDIIQNTKPVDQISMDVAAPLTPMGTIIDTKYAHIKLKDLSVIGTLGVGGFGRVELVQYKKKETFALKYLKKRDMVQQQQQEHAYSEKDIMASCDSPFIVKLYNTYRDKKYLYFLMEACLGGDVWTILQKHKFFDEKTARFMTACVIEAFEYMHTRNMIYRDLKPENLMLDGKGYVKLVDFGFAKKINPTHKTWTFAGTPEYVAPEIILSKGHDRACDYWALGVFVHELLVGKPPFRGKDHMKTYNLILRGIDLEPMPPRIPKKAQNLIKRLCRQSPTERLGYQRDGVADIKKHTWFTGFDWDKLENQTMAAPLICPVRSNTDLSNFDKYPQDVEDPPDENSGWDIHF